MINPESFAHHFRKLQSDGAARNTGSTNFSTTTTNLNLPPPPAYTPSANMLPPVPSNLLSDDVDDEYDEDEDDAEAAGTTTTITVTAPVKVVGHGNILNTSSLASVVSTALTTALQQHEQQMQAGATAETGDDNPSRVHARGDNPKRTPRSLCMNVNCGVSIVGSRNVVGESVAKAALAVRMSAISAAAAGAAVTSTPDGTNPSPKRPAEEVSSPTIYIHQCMTIKLMASIRRPMKELRPPRKSTRRNDDLRHSIVFSLLDHGLLPGIMMVS